MEGRERSGGEGEERWREGGGEVEGRGRRGGGKEEEKWRGGGGEVEGRRRREEGGGKEQGEEGYNANKEVQPTYYMCTGINTAVNTAYSFLTRCCLRSGFTCWCHCCVGRLAMLLEK